VARRQSHHRSPGRSRQLTSSRLFEHEGGEVRGWRAREGESDLFLGPRFPRTIFGRKVLVAPWLPRNTKLRCYLVTWQIEPNGSKIFTHHGWKIRVCGPDTRGHRIEVSAPYSRREGITVEIEDNDVDFSGSSWGEGGYWLVSLPWVLMEALVEARREILSS